MSKNIFISLYFVIRYFIIMLLVFLTVGVYKIEVYGFLILIYYIAINYLAIKYGIINEIDKRKDLDKKKIFKYIIIFLVIFNIGIYLIYKFKFLEIILLSIIPIIEFYLIKTKKDKQIEIDKKTRKAIEEYFKNKN